MYYESVAAGRPQFWVVPPANVFAADMGDTLVNSIFAFSGTWLAVGGIQYIFNHSVDTGMCLAWSSIIAGAVMLSPVAGDVLADLLSDIRMGWERGHVEPESEPEPKQQIEAQAEPESTEDEAGAARITGAWWYRDLRGVLKCYHTPLAPARGNESAKPIISDQRMVAIFSEVTRGTPFSERKMCDKLPGLSGPQFRKLQDDWTHPTRQLYVIRPDRSGYFTRHGKLIVDAIRTTQL